MRTANSICMQRQHPFLPPTPAPGPTTFQRFTHSFGTSHDRPIATFNLLSYLPNQRENHLKYLQAFAEFVGNKYGESPIFAGFGITQQQGEGGWEDTALVAYPSIWDFANVLDEEGYAQVDRKFKVGVIKDIPILCCTEMKL